MVSDSNDVVINKLEQLKIGESDIQIVIPKRTLNVGSYVVYLNFASRFNIGGENVDSPQNVCTFTLTDEKTMRAILDLAFEYSVELGYINKYPC